MSGTGAEDDDGEEPALPETTNLTDPKSVKRSRDRLKRERQEAESFWRAVLADKVGRRVIWSLIEQAHAFEERFACGPNGFPQPESTWFQAGEQAFGMRLYHSLLMFDRAGTLLMQDEWDPRFAQPKVQRVDRSAD